MARERICGIYKIENKIDGKIYLGLSINIHHRMSVHLSALRKGYEENSYLQNAWNKYGESNFEFGIVETCTPEDLLEREIFLIKSLNTIRPNGYNIHPGGSVPPNNKGSKFTKSHKEKIATGLMGNVNGKYNLAKKRKDGGNFAGVSWDKTNGSWKASLTTKNKKRCSRGGFLSEEDAARGRDFLLWKEYKNLEYLAFPENVVNGKYIGKFKRSAYAEKWKKL